MKPHAEVKDSLRNFVYQKFPAAGRRNVADDDSLLTGGIVDSLGVLELVQFMEESFGITLSDEDLLSENFETISGMAELVAAAHVRRPPAAGHAVTVGRFGEA